MAAIIKAAPGIEERREPPPVGFMWILLERHAKIIAIREGRSRIGTPFRITSACGGNAMTSLGRP
jgi:hypothetical protein